MQERNDVESAPSNKFKEEIRRGPEALTSSDTRWINRLRILLIGTLFVVAVGISIATYEFMARTEYKNFKNEFERTTARIKQLFLQDLSLKLYIAHLAVYSLQKETVDESGFLDVKMQFLEDLNLAQAITYWGRLGWSPLLKTEYERKKWEAYAQKLIRDSQNASNNVCNVCGEGMEIGSPGSIVNVPGEGGVPCYYVGWFGLNGYISPVECSLIPTILAPCQCRKAAANSTRFTPNATERHIASRIFGLKDDKHVPEKRGPYSPVWQGLPSVPDDELLYDQMSDPFRRHALMTMMDSRLPAFTHTSDPGEGYEKNINLTAYSPTSAIFFPVFGNTLLNGNTIIGSISLDFTWQSIFGYTEKLPFNSAGIVLVIESNQGQSFTYEIGEDRIASFVSFGDQHDPRFDSMMNTTTFNDLHNSVLRASPRADVLANQTAVLYKLRVYPSAMFMSQFVTNKPAIYTSAVASIFLFTSAIFIIFDILVRRRQNKVLQSAIQANAIVTSLFPESIMNRLMGRVVPRPGRDAVLAHVAAPKQQLITMLKRLNGKSSEIQEVADSSAEPIADFFPNTTVIFADIAGFTAWSSEREPSQVFQLLETVYREFDIIAERLGVFKIETIGDCYVAVTGLPDPQPDHAVRMARFAHEIMYRMHELVGSMESTLGPGTGNLTIRVGLHSGPVTGGVLRGDKARFQLFGDTMNTAARMQSTGEVRMVQTTDATAALLKGAGLSCWLKERDTKVSVKGKGEMQTFWIDLDVKANDNFDKGLPEDQHIQPKEDYLCPLNTHNISRAKEEVDLGKVPVAASLERLTSFNCELLEKFLKLVVAGRTSSKRNHHEQGDTGFSQVHGNPIEEVTEIIAMSNFCKKSVDEQQEPETIELSAAVRSQLRQYVEGEARMYRDNPFHNFEHASHVTMSASKTVKRIVKPDDVDYQQQSVKKKDRRKAVAQQIHKSTFGIGSDTLMQFAVIFSAVIHDMDHTGVPNILLSKESDEIAIKYGHKSAAEQHSVRLAWDLLMEDRFADLRSTIFATSEERTRFRQLVVNAVIATDIADAELQLLRKNRWNKAFYDSDNVSDDDNRDVISCRATVVFEYIIQASDVAHTMQHWHVYCKWNKRLFHERYRAYLAGREEEDPSEIWYNGELGFFDNYVIPLARKLETCGVFGVSSDEYLNYALENREEWERKGEGIVHGWKEKYCQQNDVGDKNVDKHGCSAGLLV